MLSPYFSLEGGDVVVEFTQQRGNHPLPAVSGYGASPDGETSVTVSILGELVPAESGYLPKPPGFIVLPTLYRLTGWIPNPCGG